MQRHSAHRALQHTHTYAEQLLLDAGEIVHTHTRALTHTDEGVKPARWYKASRTLSGIVEVQKMYHPDQWSKYSVL